MIFRAKLAYITVGFQMMGSFIFALFGKLGFSIMALALAIIGWYHGEFYSKQTEDKRDAL